MLSMDEARAEEFIASRRRLATLGLDDAVHAVESLARQVRLSDLEMIGRAGLGHIGGDFSVDRHPRDPVRRGPARRPGPPGRPGAGPASSSARGTAAGALYSTLAHCGFFPLAELETFAQPLSALNGHPNRTKVPGVETNTGPLGHGFPVAVGCALAAQLQGSSRRTFVVLGDGELQEGSNWEAAMTAGHYGLASLTAIVDRNRLQQGARTEDTKQLEPLADKWAQLRLGGPRGRRPRPRRAARRHRPRRPTGAPGRASSPTRSRARASRSWRTASSGTTRCRPPSRSSAALEELSA